MLASHAAKREEGRCARLHCYGTLSGQGDLVNTRHLFFLDVGRMHAVSRDSIQFHMVSYCSAIKAIVFKLQMIY